MTDSVTLRGVSSGAAMGSLICRVGVLRHPWRTARILRMHGGSLPAAIELGALRDERKIALVRGAEQISYARLRRALHATAAALADRCEAGGRVGIGIDQSAASVVLLAAALAAGLDAVPLGRRLSQHDRDAVADQLRLTDLLDPARDVLWDGGRQPARAAGQLMILSSGSTGTPRVTGRRSFRLRALIPLADLDRRIHWPAGPVLVLAPLDHGHGLSAVVAGFLRGATVLLGAQSPSDEIVAMAADHQPSCVTGVPMQLARAVRAGAFDSGHLRLIVSGSSRLQDELAEEMRVRTGARVIDCLGTTETGTFAVRLPPEGFQPLAGVRLLVDHEHRVIVDTPLADEPTPTGDTGEVSAAGLHLHGRADGLVDTAGELVSPLRMRRAFESLPQVVSCRIDAVDDELRGTLLIARVEVHDSPGVEASDLREALLPVLGRSGLPQRIDIVSPAQRPA
ncbi:AMP-binding protein [Microbacterium sp.]|uniref:AMP-binding protein n=1 Tax=Microbacterium sp. TaxID=51671 RepID=UPI00262C75AE|nr:AMP-binding protein [Microbacterium sp.]